MDTGAFADRGADRIADTRARGDGLALRRQSAPDPRSHTGAGTREATLRFGRLALGIVAIGTFVGATSGVTTVAAAEPYTWRLPRGFPVPAVPADNPMSEAKVALGRKLFFETRLSVTGQHSCASCHDPVRAFSDHRPVAVGATGEPLPHNAMALVNVAYNVSYGWAKPEVRSLEAQMLEPLLNEHPVELGLKGREEQVVALLVKDASYKQAFASAFAGEDSAVTLDNLVKAIAAFERTLISGDSSFDRYVFAGEHTALSDSAKRGMKLFFSEQTGCSGCHAGFNFSGNWRDAQGETGEPSFEKNATSEQAMRVPTLRNIALTAPYMHNGRFANLEAVLDHYTAVGGQAGTRLPVLKLTAQERNDLIAFLRSLTDEAFARRFSEPPPSHSAIQ